MTRSSTSRTYSLLLLLVASTYTASAQGIDIRGIVSDSLTGQRIPFANVIIVGTTRGAATNNSGFYLIPGVARGTYEIAASVIGYQKKTHRVIVTSDKPIDLDFRLSQAPVESNEVLVMGTRRREITEINTSVHLLEAQDLKITPVLAQEDVFQSLKLLPGIVSTSDVSSRFYVRGGAGDQNLVLLDGMKIYNPFHALGIFSVFDPDIVQNVEMYTGAFPAGYGGRLSSVVNITSRDGRSDRVSGKAGVNFISSKAQLEGPLFEGMTWMVNARKSLFSETFRKIVNQDVPASFYDVFAKLKGQLPGGTKVDFSFLTSSDRLMFPLSTDPDYLWHSTALSGSISDLIADRVFVQAVAYGSIYQANRDAKLSKLASSASTSIKEPGLRAQATYYTDSQDLFFFGFDFSFPILDYKPNDNAGIMRNVSSSYVDAASWIRYQAHYRRWLVDFGLHVELGAAIVGEQGLDAFQPRVNVSYELMGNWKVKASAGLFSQRSIAVANEDDVMPMFDAWIKVPGNLTPERAYHFVAGLDGNLSEQTSLSLQSYYKNYRSLVVYNRNKVDATESDFISGAGDSYGVELMLRSRVSFVDLYAMYVLSWTTLDNNGFGYYPRYDRRHHVNLLASTRPLERLELTARWEFGSGFPLTESLGYYDRLAINPFGTSFEVETGQPYISQGKKNAGRFPIYHRLDISLVYHISVGGLKGYIGGQITNAYDNINVFYFDRKTGAHADMLRFFPSATVTLEY
jgi:hypothetical protein